MFCSVFALEGLFGMVPAIYMDVTQDGSQCNSTQTLSMSIEGYVAAHLLLQSILPFLLPFLLMAYPLVHMIRHGKGICDNFQRQIVRNVSLLGGSYIIIYLPVAFLTIIIFPTILQ